MYIAAFMNKRPTEMGILKLLVVWQSDSWNFLG